MGGLMADKRLKLFFDGGCRPNPGRVEAAVVARGTSYFFDDLGIGTSSDAEWLALLAALGVAHSLGVAEFDLIGDCANVIAQARGEAPCRSRSCLEHRERLQAASVQPRRIRWIARTQNLAGIALERRRNIP
ncbi:MAG TPA: reverse transcriptase-like protein [Allosphingosinicella sp.]|jgi:ribonuclease HI